MSPTRTKADTTLFDEVRSLGALKNAWDHVRGRALQSNDAAVRRERAIIEADPLRYLRRLQRELGANRFIFEAQRGVLKKRTGKDPRPLVVAPLRNRIVHRAILDVCQSDRPRIRSRLGQLPAALATPTSVGGLPERGVGLAIKLIKEAVHGGATHYVRSDLKSFFAKIPRPKLNAFLDAEVPDEAFTTLFKAALDVDLANANEPDVAQWWSLFPNAELGVPQGSALSAISANIVLSDFDRELNSGGITTIRYLDDFLIVGPSVTCVMSAWQRALGLLAELGLEAHQPGESAKAAEGSIAGGFEFLGFRVQGVTIAPSRAAKSELLEELDGLIRDAKRDILRTAGDPRRAERRFVQILDRIDRKVRGWGDAFKETTQRVEFSQLDDRVGERVAAFIDWFLRLQRSHSVAARRRMWGIALLTDTPRPST